MCFLKSFIKILLVPLALTSTGAAFSSDRDNCIKGDASACKRAIFRSAGQNMDDLQTLSVAGCKTGDSFACALSERNYGKLTKECSKNLALACMFAGVFEMKENEDQFKTPSGIKFLRLIKEDCQKGDMLACAHAGSIEYETGDKAEGKKMLEKSCAEKEQLGCNKLGDVNVTASNEPEAQKYFTISCGLDDEIGCKKLAIS